MSAADRQRDSLDRPVAPDYERAWAETLRQPASGEEVRDAATLLFRIGREWFGLPVELAASVSQIQSPHRLPHRGGALLGVVNVDGRLVPALSLPVLLGLDTGTAAAITGRHVFGRLLVVLARGQRFALPVDEVAGIERYRSADVQVLAANAGRGATACVHGVIALSGRETGLLDGGHLSSALHGALR